MNYEEFESLWAGQPRAPTTPLEVEELKRRLVPEVRRRGRMLGYEAFVVGFTLVVYPLLSVINFLHARPANLALWVVNVALHLTALLALTGYVIRRIRRHRAQVCRATESIRSCTELSLASVNAEIRDYRWLPAIFALSAALTLLSIHLNVPLADHGFRPFAFRAGLVAVFFVLVGAVFWRHYRVNLQPNRIRLQEILRQLS